jgi:oligopeptide transport system substrate-binding protein
LDSCSRPLKNLDILHIGNGTEPATLDPHLATGYPELRVLGTLTEGLLRRGYDNGSLAPGIARAYSFSSDGREVLFVLRKARWSDGEPLTAHDFVYSWRRFGDPKTAAEYAGLLRVIKNGDAVRTGVMPTDSLGVYALNDSTLKVSLEYPVKFFLDLCAFEPFAAVPEHAIRKFGVRWTRAENWVGNGPYQITNYRRNVKLTVGPNQYYWDSLPDNHPSAIVFHAIEDQNTSYQMFLAGDLDWLFSVPTSRLTKALKNPDFLKGAMYGTYYLLVNTRNTPFDSPSLRTALSLSIDRARICSTLLKGLPVPTANFVPPTAGFITSRKILFDPDSARAELKKAGFSQANPPLGLQILFNNSESNKSIAEAIQQMWKTELGLEAELANYEWKVYLENTKNGNYPSLARASWIGDFSDPISFLELGETGNGNNRSFYSQPVYDSLIRLSWGESDSEKRMTLLAKAEEILLEDSPVIPIYHYSQTEMRSPRLKAPLPNPLGMIPWKSITLGAP